MNQIGDDIFGEMASFRNHVRVEVVVIIFGRLPLQLLNIFDVVDRERKEQMVHPFFKQETVLGWNAEQIGNHDGRQCTGKALDDIDDRLVFHILDQLADHLMDTRLP
ncbi:hypothetical protein D3C85_1482100 [compost metagenome]